MPWAFKKEAAILLEGPRAGCYLSLTICCCWEAGVCVSVQVAVGLVTEEGSESKCFWWL
jgi:hypothetical protein